MVPLERPLRDTGDKSPDVALGHFVGPQVAQVRNDLQTEQPTVLGVGSKGLHLPVCDVPVDHLRQRVAAQTAFLAQPTLIRQAVYALAGRVPVLAGEVPGGLDGKKPTFPELVKWVRHV